MKQILQNIRSGATQVADLPRPQAGRGQLLICTRASLISAGTERMLVEFGKAGWLDKVRQQPEKVRMVLEKIRTDGLLATVDAVRSKLDQPIPMGYSSVGTVVEIGAGVSGFAIGDRVASNGHHAEVVAVPANLCARVPATVADEPAAFTVLGAVALQGVRLAQPTLGESFVVSGLGLIGLLAVQLLRAQGCRVLGTDFDAARLALAREYGAETIQLGAAADWQSAALAFSRGRGVDGVLIAASTDSDEPVHQAAQMCRKRGRIVLLGVAGLNLRRSDFYEKELTFQVSCSYGPGRYDTAYEDKGQDYPVGFVRWTEQRNFEAALDMLAEGKLHVSGLVSHRFPVERAPEAYEVIVGPAQSLGVLLEYPGAEKSPASVTSATVAATPGGQGLTRAVGTAVGFLGAGAYASRILGPAFSKGGARIKVVSSAGGTSAGIFAGKHGVPVATSDNHVVFGDADVGTVVIATRHDSHADLVCQALAAGKHVFVEKPLAIALDELARVRQAYESARAMAGAPLVLMVGFNRRFSPHVRRMKPMLAQIGGPKCFVMTVNAGDIPGDHWIQDREQGGGRVIGEACHFIDLLRFLAGAEIRATQVSVVGGESSAAVSDDKVTISLEFADGSIGTVHYFANGHRSFPKERLEVFCAGRILQLDNFRRLRAWGWPGSSSHRLWRQDKGQQECVNAFLAAAGGRAAAPIPVDEIFEVSRVTIEAASMAVK
jgi:predicted dehydrogenase/threonine dehydrogenase-like Zn-dependent dehydrogenase